jgi:hypothetical protein
MYRKELKEIIEELVLFKSNMGLKLSIKKLQYIWGKGIIKGLDESILNTLERGTKEESSNITQKKIEIANERVKSLLVSNWVRFVGISGSVAAGFTKEDDDIDLFIVVRDGSAWIYRGILTVRNIFNHIARTSRDGNTVKDLFCINFIVEERGLELESDIFNFHELMYLIPLYNERYLNHIYRKNRWLLTKYFINKELVVSRERELKRVNIFLRIINWLAYIAQILFMILSGHRPEIDRLLSNYKEGRIEFFPKEYKSEVMKSVIKK